MILALQNDFCTPKITFWWTCFVLLECKIDISDLYCPTWVMFILHFIHVIILVNFCVIYNCRFFWNKLHLFIPGNRTKLWCKHYHILCWSRQSTHQSCKHHETLISPSIKEAHTKRRYPYFFSFWYIAELCRQWLLHLHNELIKILFIR